MEGMTDAEFASVCAVIKDGPTLKSALCTLGFSSDSFYAYLGKNPHREPDYTRAREARLVAKLDVVEDMAGDPTANPQQVRNLSDIVKWRTAREFSAVYGDKLEMTVQGNLSLRDAMAARLIGDSSTAVDVQAIEHNAQSALPAPVAETGTKPEMALIDALLS